jgi:hypothetical protein
LGYEVIRDEVPRRKSPGLFCEGLVSMETPTSVLNQRFV